MGGLGLFTQSPMVAIEGSEQRRGAFWPRCSWAPSESCRTDSMGKRGLEAPWDQGRGDCKSKGRMKEVGPGWEAEEEEGCLDSG